MRIKEIQNTIYQIKRESKKSMPDKKRKTLDMMAPGLFYFRFF